ncbi:DUF192 domain-containing protein [Planktothrix sp. FACHB-1355]|uniref:DUF192 domain-containing protein n=2 Tax=Aerosakkonema funiforme TaxID=1246630 RepID=A0A926VGE1_9CYAN|nr:DUF192 domain-containing protein [Planktothrix sp. FACHB-1355]MBD2183430.1 DUF192 domain-containing protein [Aerosakkonema funiforme FACHB-1375]MBD3557625.1 DUF192 domain-containing protein [Planktothrix sp. FACHB-1355]
MGCSPLGPATSAAQQSVVTEQVTSQPTDSKESQTDLSQMLPVSATAKMGEEVIELEVTRTPEQQAMGLMYRTALPDNRGMLFEFQPAQTVSFWMKNVKIPLDMVFLREGVIKAIALNVPPCTSTPCPTYGPNTLIDRVIELRGGRAAELKLKVGQRVEVRFLPPNSVNPSLSQP